MWTVRKPWMELLGCVLTVIAPSPAWFRAWNPSVLSVNLNIPEKVTFISGYIPLSYSDYSNFSVVAYLIVTTICKLLQIPRYAINCHFSAVRIWKSLTVRLGVVTSHLVILACCGNASYGGNDMQQHFSRIWTIQKSQDASAQKMRIYPQAQGKVMPLLPTHC